MARIGLIDVDSRNFPNIALMKLSSYHKAKGDFVEWYMPFNKRYDIVYKSKVFSFTEDYDLSINADTVISGGSGYAIETVNEKEIYRQERDIPLGLDIEHCYPDYSLYPRLTKDTAYGFLTRGCPRGCSFCIVGKKEGACSIKVADLNDFWRGQRNVILCDPNILACNDWRELLQQLVDAKVTVDFNQGLDIRLMTPDKAEILNKIRLKEIRFSWDRYADKEIIVSKLREFSNKAKPHGDRAVVYCLVNFDSTFEQDLDRIYTLRDMGYLPYVMVYNKKDADRRYRRLQRWCNMRSVFKSVDRFEEYK